LKDFFVVFKAASQDILKLSRPRSGFKNDEKRLKKEPFKFADRFME